MNLYDCFLDDYNDEKFVKNVSDLDVRAQLEGIFFFSCVWSFGGSLDLLSREKFSELFRGLLNREFPQDLCEKFRIPNELHVPNLQKPYIFTMPPSGSVFDYRYTKEGKGKWKLWSDEIAQAAPLPRDIPVNQIIITTPETIRVTAIMDLLVKHGKPLMLVGPTGTGKSVYTIDYLLKKVDQSLFTPLFINFSAQITANQTQDIIMAKLDKRRKGVYGPPLGKKCVVFVDDVSMPIKVILIYRIIVSIAH